MLECLMDKNVYIMIEWEGLMGKYLAQAHDIQTRCSDCKPNIFLRALNPTRSISILSYDY